MDSQYSSWPRLGRSPHLPLYNVLCDWPHGLHSNVIFLGTPKSRIPKFPKLELKSLWMLIRFFEDLLLNWGLKQSCIFHQEVSNDMWHALCMHVIKSDSQLLMVESQMTLSCSSFFDHKLCYKYSNGSCEPILDICMTILGNSHNMS